jgi:hypothetical protein
LPSVDLVPVVVLAVVDRDRRFTLAAAVRGAKVLDENLVLVGV